MNKCKCLVSAESKTICELQKALNKVNVKLGYVGEVVEYIESYGIVVLVKIKLPYFEPKNLFDKEYLFYKKNGYVEVLLPRKFVIEVKEDETT